MRDLRFSQYCCWDATPYRLVKLRTFRRTLLLYIQCTGRRGRLHLSVRKNSAIVISSFRREVDENCVLLGHYLAGGGNCVPTIRDNRSHLQAPRNKKEVFLISNFRRVLNHVCILLGIFRRLIVVCRRFGTLYLFHLHRLDSHPAYEDGTDRVFRNVGIQQSDAGEIPKRIHI